MPLKNGGPNLVRRLITVAANNAVAPTQVFATGPTRGWRIIESPVTVANGSQATQGFEVQIPNDNTTAGFGVWFARPAIVAGVPYPDNYFENWNQIAEHGPVGEAFAGIGGALGAGIGTTNPTLLCNVQSLTSTATTIEIVEYF